MLCCAVLIMITMIIMMAIIKLTLTHNCCRIGESLACSRLSLFAPLSELD